MDGADFLKFFTLFGILVSSWFDEAIPTSRLQNRTKVVNIRRGLPKVPAIWED